MSSEIDISALTELDLSDSATIVTVPTGTLIPLNSTEKFPLSWFLPDCTSKFWEIAELISRICWSYFPEIRCAELKLKTNVGIIENIVYSGVYLRYKNILQKGSETNAK